MVEPAEHRNILRMLVTQGYTQLVQDNRNTILRELESHPDGSSVLRKYHRQVIDEYQGQLTLLAAVGAEEGETGSEMLSFMADLDAQMSAIDRIYGLV